MALELIDDKMNLADQNNARGFTQAVARKPAEIRRSGVSTSDREVLLIASKCNEKVDADSMRLFAFAPSGPPMQPDVVDDSMHERAAAIADLQAVLQHNSTDKARAENIWMVIRCLAIDDESLLTLRRSGASQQVEKIISIREHAINKRRLARSFVQGDLGGFCNL